MNTKSSDASNYLAAASELAPSVSAAAGGIDRQRQIPQDLFDELAGRGFFRLLVPRSLDGAQMELPGYLRIIRTFGEVDASVAWCINQNNVFATNAVRMTEEAAREIWNDPRAVLANGPPDRSAIAVPVQGGYRLSGRWNFSSGIRHASWVAAVAPVAGRDTPGDPEVLRRGLVLLVPKQEIELLDVWQVNGLRGTGSFSFTARDVFVPERRTYRIDAPAREDGAVYVLPTVLLFAAGFANVALGASRAALDAAIALAGTKTHAHGTSTLGEMDTTRRAVGSAEAEWRSALAFLREAADAVWNGAQAKAKLTVEERIHLRLAATHAIRSAAAVVDAAYELGGSNSIFESNPIQRRYQDVHAITQQIQGRATHYDTAGGFFLGQEPRGIF